ADDELELLGDALALQPFHVAPRDIEDETELCLRELSAGLDLRNEAVGTPLVIGDTRHVGGADEELRGRQAGPLRRQHTAVAHAADHGHELDRVEVEYRLGLGLVAAAGIISLQYQ